MDKQIHPANPLGATVFRVGFAGLPLGCAAFFAYCLFTNRRTLTGLIFSVLLIGVVLAVRIYGMGVDSTVQQSLPLVKSEIVLVVISLVGIAIEIGRRSYARRSVPFPEAVTVA